jgi:hypothetical protein
MTPLNQARTERQSTVGPWVLFVIACIVVRTAIYGAPITASVMALFGMSNGDMFGPLPSHRIDLFDLMLAAGACFGVVMAAKAALLQR